MKSKNKILFSKLYYVEGVLVETVCTDILEQKFSQMFFVMESVLYGNDYI